MGGGAYAWRASQAPGVSAASRPVIGGDFQLVDQDAKPVDEQILRGRWTAVFFGYTYCPDFCPATLQALQAATGQLGPDGRKVQVLLITVDPERDSPAALKAFLEGYSFPGGVRGLTGTPEQIDAAAKAWRVYHRRSEPRSGHGTSHGYLVDHSTTVFLMDPEGRFAAVLPSGLSPEETARQISAAMKA